MKILCLGVETSKSRIRTIGTDSSMNGLPKKKIALKMKDMLSESDRVAEAKAEAWCKLAATQYGRHDELTPPCRPQKAR